MPRNDDGEYELVLGNRQLLSGFFLLVVLFGVFFTMGYFVGRHSTPSQINAAAPAAAPSTAEPSTAPVTASLPAPGSATVVPAAETPKPVATQPVKPDPPVAQPVSRPAPASAVSAAPAPRAAPTPTAGSAPGLGRVTPAGGDIYLQVSAPAPAAAPSVVEALRKKGITAIIADGPDASTVRVLVGPLVPADIPAERAKLESAGFKPFVRKY